MQRLSLAAKVLSRRKEEVPPTTAAEVRPSASPRFLVLSTAGMAHYNFKKITVVPSAKVGVTEVVHAHLPFPDKEKGRQGGFRPVSPRLGREDTVDPLGPQCGAPLARLCPRDPRRSVPLSETKSLSLCPWVPRTLESLQDIRLADVTTVWLVVTVRSKAGT